MGLRGLATVAACTIGSAVGGGFVGLFTATACEATGVVKYSRSLDSWTAAIRSLVIGTGTGGLFGFGWSVQRWYRNSYQIVEVEDELSW